MIVESRSLTLEIDNLLCNLPVGILPEPKSKHFPKISLIAPERMRVISESF